MVIGANSLVVCAFACAALAFAFLLALLGSRFFALLSDAFSRMSRPRLAAFLFFAAVATLCAQKQGTTNSPPDGVQSSLPSRQDFPPSRSGGGGHQVTNFTFTAISAATNGVELSLAWPTNLFADGACLDFFAKVDSLTNAWQWIGCEAVSAGETNLDVIVGYDDLHGSTNAPAAAFFRVADRSALAPTMDDADGDGIPDVYELFHGTNPYVPDYELAPKLTVGPDGDYATVPAALAASTNYSIVALAPGEYSLPSMFAMPAHPVMLTGPQGGYAVLRSDHDVAAVILDRGQDCETLFRNLIVVMAAQGSFQAGFWVGGNTHVSGLGASPTFRNVRVRALYPDVVYYGWHYYLDDGGVSEISDCVVNAAGANLVIGVYSFGGPEVAMDNFNFVNLPDTNGCCTTCFREGSNIVAECTAPAPGLSWAGYPLDGDYSATADSDGDGLSDYAEIFVHDTDPWLADSDGDGIADGVEVADGTSPQDLSSFLRHVAVTVVEDDPLAGVTNYVAWGTSASGWETNGMVVAQGQVSTFEFTIASQSGSVYVKAFRDVDRNGVFDPGTDLLVSRLLPARETSTSVTIRFGDLDGDGFADSLELAEGTDPNDARSYCFNLALVERGVVGTTNDMTALVVFGEEVVHGPVVVSNGVFEADVGHLVATNREAVTVYFWDDANSDGMRDDGEFSISRTVAISGHENSVTNDFQAELMDRDRDGMPDWWELANAAAGLSPYTSGDARQDPDGDGLVNLHEYWANCNPLVYDGTNTLLSVCARSIDDRIRNVVPSNSVALFVDYFTNGADTNFIANTNCWARDLNLSCVSVWHGDNGDYGSKTATAITRRHVILSSHWWAYNKRYYFCDTNGVVYTRSIVNDVLISDDLRLGRLDEPLPSTIKLPKIPPADIANYVSSGKFLPTLCVNQEKAATVLEIDDLDIDVVSSGGGHYHHYVRTATDNVVSGDRHAIRAATLGGNSSTPVFLVVGNDLVFVFSKHLGSWTELTWCNFYGPATMSRASAVQQQIDVWEGADAGQYQMELLDLGQFDKSVNGGVHNE